MVALVVDKVTPMGYLGLIHGLSDQRTKGSLATHSPSMVII